MSVDKEHIVNNQKCFLNKKTGMLDKKKLKLEQVHKNSTKVLYIKKCSDNELPKDLQNTKDEFMKQVNGEAWDYRFRTKFTDVNYVNLELIKSMNSPNALASGHFVSVITTVLQTEETEHSNNPTNMQDMHVDFKFNKEINLAKPRKFDDSNDRTRLVVFFPISCEGMLIEIFPQHSNTPNVKHDGKALYIPFGYALVIREDVVHAGGMLCTKYNQGEYANPRVHYYVGYEPYPSLKKNGRKTRSVSKVSINEENDYSYYDHSEDSQSVPRRRKFTETYVHDSQIQKCQWDIAAEHAPDLGEYQFRDPMKDIL